jgi:PleD family two-component response regulator
MELKIHPSADEISISASLGVAQINPNDSFPGLLDCAGHAMYHAKQHRRNRVEIESD